MNEQEILVAVNAIAKNILVAPELDLKMSTETKSIKDWDSIRHIRLVVEVEKSFGIRFTFSQMRSWVTVGDLCQDILSLKSND